MRTLTLPSHKTHSRFFNLFDASHASQTPGAAPRFLLDDATINSALPEQTDKPAPEPPEKAFSLPRTFLVVLLAPRLFGAPAGLDLVRGPSAVPKNPAAIDSIVGLAGYAKRHLCSTSREGSQPCVDRLGKARRVCTEAMKSPDDLKALLRRQWENRSLREARLLRSENVWPLVLSIGRPSPRLIQTELGTVKRHVETWRRVKIGEVVWEAIRYRATDSAVEIPTGGSFIGRANGSTHVATSRYDTNAIYDRRGTKGRCTKMVLAVQGAGVVPVVAIRLPHAAGLAADLSVVRLSFQRGVWVQVTVRAC